MISTTEVKNRLDKLPHKKNLFSSFLLLLIIGLISIFSPYRSIIENQSQYSDEGKKAVLGYNTPHIYISGKDDGYGRGGMIALASTDEPSVTISGWDVSGELDVWVYEADEQALFDYLIHDKEGKQINKSVDESNFRLIKKLKHRMSGSRGESSGLLLPLEDSGIYFLKIRKGDISADSFVLRSENGALVKEGDNEFIFWGQNYKSRRSMTEGSISVYDLQDQVKQIEDASFDSNGIAKTRLSANADIAFIRSAGDKAVIPINLQYLNYGYRWDSFQPKKIATKFFTFTDRPLYGPGDTIYFKSIIRDDDDARYSIPATQVIVRIFDGWDEDDKIFEKSFPVSDTGAVNGEYKLPENAKTGDYYLKVEVPGMTRDYFSYDTYFNVEYFRKPEYTIDVNVAEREYIAGDKIPFTISGNYFSGQPLTGGEIKYVIYSSDYYDYEYVRDAQRYLNDDYRYSYRWGKEVDSGVVNLDNEGIAEVNIDALIPDDKNTNQVYAIEVSYNDQSENPVFSRKNVLVYAGEFGIYRDIDSGYRYTTKVNEKLSLPVILVSHIKGEVDGVSLTSEVKRENWVKYQKKDEKYPSYRMEEENLRPLNAATDSEGKTIFSFTPTKPGSYVFTIEGKDDRGNTVEKTFRRYVTSDSESYYYNDKNNDLVIQADKESYLPDETVRFTISSNLSDRDIFLSLERGRTNRYQVVKMNGNRVSVDVPLANTDMPNIFAKASSFSDHTYDSGSTNVIVSPESKKLVVDVTPDKKEYGPGDTATINVSTTDIGGRPVSAEVAVWAVDKAIFELVDESLGTIFDTFWSERYHNTQEAHSLEGIPVLTAEGGGCFGEGTRIMMENGQEKLIENVKKGDYVLTRVSESNPKLVKARVTGVHKVSESGYMILNSSLRITADHKIWVNDTWKNAGSIQIGDSLTDSEGKVVKVNSIEWLSGNYEVYNLTIEKYNTFFADGMWVHNQKGGGGGRSVFKDTAYWNPTLRTNDAGRAQVSFKLPDNLTTWAIAGVGATRDTIVGQTVSELIVTKDVIVRPILPNILRVGDEIVLSTLVQNSTDEDYKFDIDFKFDEGNIKSATRSGELVKSKANKQIFWDTKINSENDKAKLTFSAVSQENEKASDTITQTIPIKEFGFNERRAQTGDGDKTFEVKLADDAHLQKSSITLSLAPTIVGTLPTAMNYLIRYPYGCVEQTTSSIVPAIIAKANPTLFANALNDKDVDEIIEDGIKRLQDQQGKDGGWAWWGTGKSDPFVTAYVVEYLVLTKNLGIEVDKEILDRVKNYLERDYYLDDSGNKKNVMWEDNISRYYALTLLGEKEKVKKISNIDDLDPDLLSYLVMTNYINGDKNPTTNGLSKLSSMAKTQGDGAFWEAGDNDRFASNDTSTAMAMRAIIIADGDRELAVKGAKYLTRNRKHDYWSNTFATAQVVRAITELSKTGDELTPNYSYTVELDGKRITQGNVNNSRQIINDIELSVEDISKNGSNLIVKKSGNGQMYSTLLISEFHTDRNTKAVENGLKITRTYVNDKGERYSLAVGDTVTVKLALSGLGAEENYGVIEDELPSGMIPINQSFKNEQGVDDDSYYSYGISNREITENGMILSLYHVSAGENVFTYKARVISEGKFSVPPATTSLMYAPEINGRTDAQSIEITKESKLLPGKIIEESLTQGSKAKILTGLIFIIFVLLTFFLIKKHGISRIQIKEKIKHILNSIKRKPPIPPLEIKEDGANATENIQEK